MNKFYDTLTNTRGDVLPNYRAQVVNPNGTLVDIFADRSKTPFTDANGGTVNYATADSEGLIEFYWEAATGQIFQMLDPAGDLVKSIEGFADNYVLDNFSGSLTIDKVVDLGDELLDLNNGLAARPTTAELASTDPVNPGAAMVGRGVVAVDSIADLLALPEGQRRGDLRYLVKGYYAGSDVGGGEFYWDAASTKADNGGTVFEVSGVATGRFVRRHSVWELWSSWFGTVGDGITDDADAFNRFFQAYAQTNYTYTSGIGLTTQANVDKGNYKIGSTIQIPFAYGDIDFNWSLFRPTDSFDQDTFAFNFSYNYTSTTRNLKLAQFDKAIRTYNNNLGSSHTVFDGVHMHNVGVAFDIEQRSTLTRVTNYKFIDVKHPAIIRAGDIVEFISGWHKAGVLGEAEEYKGFWQILEGSVGPRLKVKDCFYNPTPQVAKDVVCFEVRGACNLDIIDSLFGGESGQVPLIGWHADGTSDGRSSGIRLKNTSFFMAQQPPTNAPSDRRAWIELYALPAYISISDVVGYTDGADARGLIWFREDFQTFESAVSNGPDRPTEIYIDGTSGVRGPGGAWLQDGRLQEFLASHSRAYYGRVSVDNSTEPTAANRINHFEWDENRTRYSAYRVCLNTHTGSADAYSEYIARMDGSTSPSFIELIPIIEGSLTTAPRLFIDDGSLYVRTNTAVTAYTITYKIEKVNNPAVRGTSD